MGKFPKQDDSHSSNSREADKMYDMDDVKETKKDTDKTKLINNTEEFIKENSKSSSKSKSSGAEGKKTKTYGSTNDM